MSDRFSYIEFFGGPVDVSYDPYETLFETTSAMECESRVRRALSRLAAAQAAHCESPGSEEHRDRLIDAAYHAEMAEDLSRSAAEQQAREDREERINAAREGFARGHFSIAAE